MLSFNKESIWKNCGFVYVIPHNGENLVVNEFTSTFLEWDPRYDLACLDLSKHEGKMIGFFISFLYTTDYWGETDSEIQLGDVHVIAENGKQAYLANAKSFDDFGIIDMDDLESLFNEDLSSAFEEAKQDHPKNLYDLSFVEKLDPEFLKSDKEEMEKFQEQEEKNSLEESYNLNINF